MSERLNCLTQIKLVSPALEARILIPGPRRESLISFNLGKGFPSGSVVDNLPAIQETQFRTLDQEDPLEKKVATHSSILARGASQAIVPGGAKSRAQLSH